MLSFISPSNHPSAFSFDLAEGAVNSAPGHSPAKCSHVGPESLVGGCWGAMLRMFYALQKRAPYTPNLAP
jgi:hypothetical protein